jgi:hypothetical protein
MWAKKKVCLKVDVVIPVQWGWQANRGGKGRGLGAARLAVRLRRWNKLIFLFWFHYFDLINFIICFHLFRISYLILFLHFHFFYFDFFLCLTIILNLPASTPWPLLLPLLLAGDHHCPSPTRISCIYKTHNVFLMWLFYLECLTLKMKALWFLPFIKRYRVTSQNMVSSKGTVTLIYLLIIKANEMHYFLTLFW